MRILLFTIATIICSAAYSAEIGRLFLTPNERIKLDELRANAKTVDLSAIKDPDPAETAAPPNDITMQGYVIRSDGKKGTVWLNGQPVQENSSENGVEVGKLRGNSNQVPLNIPGSGKSVKLKAGQTYDPFADQVKEIDARPTPMASEKKQKNLEDSGTIGLENLPEEIKRKLNSNPPSP
jgi:hypothetical protein